MDFEQVGSVLIMEACTSEQCEPGLRARQDVCIRLSTDWHDPNKQAVEIDDVCVQRVFCYTEQAMSELKLVSGQRDCCKGHD